MLKWYPQWGSNPRPRALPLCSACCYSTHVTRSSPCVDRWRDADKSQFPTWALAMRIVGSWTPNSAAAERVFSLLKAMFGDEQLSALVDMIETALALKYNERKVG